MNREIKFRAWCIPNNEFNNYVEVYSYVDGSVGYSAGLRNNQAVGNSENFIIEQFTGIKDKKGKDIYEGDIVQWKTRRFKSVYTGLKEDRDKLQTITWKSAVEWDMNCFCITESFDSTQNNNSPLVDDETLEIIGNIHENHALPK